MGEVLNEDTTVTPSIWITLEDPTLNSQLNRKLSLVQQNPLILVPISSASSSSKISSIPHQDDNYNEGTNNMNEKEDGNEAIRSHLNIIEYPLPLNVHLLSLRVMGGDYPPNAGMGESTTSSLVYLIRLQHIFEVNEHPIYSNPVKVIYIYKYSPLLPE